MGRDLSVFDYEPPQDRLRRQARARLEAPRPEKKSRPGATRFTTDYAIAWGRGQGWRLLDRERYDPRLKRHFDLMLGVDALFDGGAVGIVGVQGAGRHERAAHYRRFEDRGGVGSAQRLHIQVFYLEFERLSKEPIVTEQWA